MRKMLWCLLVPLALALGLPDPAAAQTRTLVDGASLTSGGFGGPSVRATRIAGHTELVTGGRGGWIINHALAIGGGGWSVTTGVDLPLAGVSSRKMDLSYGGFEVIGIIRSGDVLHSTVSLLVGAANATVRTEGLPRTSDYAFVAEPTVSAELNVTERIRVTAGFGYRWLDGIHVAPLVDSDLSAT